MSSIIARYQYNKPLVRYAQTRRK